MSMRWLLVLSALTMLAACSRERSVRCSGHTVYLEAQSAGQLRVPEDLSLPDETDALRVPGPVAPGESAENAEGCLEYSPAFAGSDDSEENSDGEE